jgi:hypothetical protein
VFSVGENIVCVVRGPIKKVNGLCVGLEIDGQTILHHWCMHQKNYLARG